MTLEIEDEPIAAPIPKDLLDFDKNAGKLSCEDLRREILPNATYDAGRLIQSLQD